MNRVVTYFLISSISMLAVSMVSCETQTMNNSSENSIKSIRLNFHDNVLDLNPLHASSRAEVFISQLVFDRFYNEDGSSAIFKSYQFDSLENIHQFELWPNKLFHDSSVVDTNSIRNFLKYLIEQHLEKEPVTSLFSNMEGFGLTNWYRQNRGVIDSIPSGFQIIDETKFTVKLLKHNELLIDWLSSPTFTLFKKHHTSIIGSGAYILANLNEDISAQLVKSPQANGQIETINLSFIKNDELVYSEFFRGALDLITYDPHNNPASAKLNKILNSKYPQYQVSQTQRTTLKYLEINEIEDSTMIKKILASMKLSESTELHLAQSQGAIFSIRADSLLSSSLADSTQVEVFWYSNIQNDQENYFTDNTKIDFIHVNSKNLNPTSPHIVINETTLDLIDTNDRKNVTLELSKKLGNAKNSSLLVLDLFPEYVIYNNNLSGIENRQTLSEMIQSAYYTNAKTY